jgi:hypothetical protein
MISLLIVQYLTVRLKPVQGGGKGEGVVEAKRMEGRLRNSY